MLFRSALNNIRIPRQCYIKNHQRIEIHGFCDASILGYGVVFYALSYDQAQNFQISILTSNSKVAPNSQKTLVRLELCAATLLSKQINRVLQTLSANVDSVTLWGDSTIVLNWMTMEPARLSTFVGNRVAVIQELTHRLTWKHIRGTENPADVISRGCEPNEMEFSHIWFNGPSFFKLPQSEWPSSIITVSEDDPEVQAEMKKKMLKTLVVQTDMNNGCAQSAIREIKRT